MNNDYDISICSVEQVPLENAAAAFTERVTSVFREDEDIVPLRITDKIQIMPWGGDNQMPFDILSLIEKDETLSTCQLFNAEICYGGGLSYDTENCTAEVSDEIDAFVRGSDFASYYLGVCQDLKHFGFAVSVLVFNKGGNRVVRIERREACYCRFEPADRSGRIPAVVYANWRKSALHDDDLERLPLIDSRDVAASISGNIGKQHYRLAFLTRIPTPDSTYYPIPHYASLFKGRWYNIKQLIALAKEAKLKNSAPVKYHVEISKTYFEGIFRAEAITDPAMRQERIVKEKRNIISFITGAENAGKVWFSMFYMTPDGKEQHDVRITKVDTSKEGGDWETDIQEAINMVCFTMRVHSNLVGSVPGKAQSNNSGSDKRELYIIAQALQKPYRDLLFAPHNAIIDFNKWRGAKPEVHFIQLTTLDEHRDVKTSKDTSHE